jgi:hypothetical protein
MEKIKKKIPSLLLEDIKLITSDSNEALFFRRNHFVYSEEENKKNTCAMLCST